MSLHNDFYNLRKRVWDDLEKLVRTGCDIKGEFPIIKGEIEVWNKSIYDSEEIIIQGIVRDERYNLHVGLEGIDLIVDTNKIKVKVHNIFTDETKIVEVEPDVLNLQCLSTYLSGGFSVYKNK